MDSMNFQNKRFERTQGEKFAIGHDQPKSLSTTNDLSCFERSITSLRLPSKPLPFVQYEEFDSDFVETTISDIIGQFSSSDARATNKRDRHNNDNSFDYDAVINFNPATTFGVSKPSVDLNLPTTEPLTMSDEKLQEQMDYWGINPVPFKHSGTVAMAKMHGEANEISLQDMKDPLFGQMVVFDHVENENENQCQNQQLENDYDSESGCESIFSIEPPMKKQKMSGNTQRESIVEGDTNNNSFRPYQAEQWTKRFQELCTYCKKHGHCQVPHTYTENAALTRWVKRQRYQYKLKQEGRLSTMTDERVRLLENIGFTWNSHSAAWEERKAELIAYYNFFGHCNVPSNYEGNRQLAVWVKRQRRQYKFFCDGKPSNLNKERVATLEAMGFEWELRCRDPKRKG